MTARVDPRLDALVAFGKAVTELREEAGLTRQQVAERSGFSESMIGRLEDGEEGATVDTVLALGPALDTSGSPGEMASVARLLRRVNQCQKDHSA